MFGIRMLIRWSFFSVDFRVDRALDPRKWNLDGIEVVAGVWFDSVSRSSRCLPSCLGDFLRCIDRAYMVFEENVDCFVTVL